jgi:hypothetical protein
LSDTIESEDLFSREHSQSTFAMKPSIQTDTEILSPEKLFFVGSTIEKFDCGSSPELEAPISIDQVCQSPPSPVKLKESNMGQQILDTWR